MADHGNCGELRLREHRMRRAMTQQEVAERLVQLAWMRSNRRVGVNADMVSKWERDEKRPSPFYRRLLCALFETTPTKLGLAAEVDPAPILAEGDYGGERTAALTEVFTVLDDMRAPVQLLQPKMLMLWREELLSRRQVLKLMGVAPTVGTVEAVDTTLQLLVPVQASPFRGPATLQELDQLIAHLEQIYHYSEPRRLLLPVRALIETAEDFLADARGREARSALLATLGRAHLLAGRLSFFDLHEPMPARAHLDLAREACQETGSHVLAATVLGHMAFLPAAKQNFSAAASYVAGARESLDRHPVSTVASWVCAVEAEISTNAGALKQAMNSLDRAREEIARAGKGFTPAWFDFYDEKRLSGFEGFTLRRAGATAAAREKLTESLAPAERGIPKQRAVTSIDLAAVCVEDGDIDEGCRLATDAAGELHRAGYATALDRLTEFRQALPDQRHPAARLLTESISELS
jgi:transcriptional regulator with XRE-family HTH domain/tetratricopeptide (TPR) repeat protein